MTTIKLKPRDAFLSEFEAFRRAHESADWYFLLSTFCNDEYSSDEELREYLNDENVEPELIDWCLTNRSEFLCWGLYIEL